MATSRTTVLSAYGYAAFSVIWYALSFYYSSAYILGDQVFYRTLFFELQGVPLTQVPYLQARYTGSAEPIYGLVTWIGAQTGLAKDVFFSIINAIMAVVLLRFLVKHSASLPYIVLAFTNFYLFVLAGPAERLKVSTLFLLIAVMQDRPAWKVAGMAVAGLSHFQTVLLVSARSVGLLSRFKLSRFVPARRLAFLIFLGSGAIMTSFWFYQAYGGAVLDKIDHYAKGRDIYAIVNIIGLGVMSIFIFRHPTELVLILCTCVVIALIVGPERVNMIAFMLFSYFVVLENRTANLLVLAAMLYFSVKGLLFVAKVFTHGTGF